MFTLRTITTLCIAAVGMPAAIAQNTGYVATVTQQLDAAESRIKPALETDDRKMISVQRIVSLTDEGTNGVFYLTDLAPNTSHLILGVCDGDCSDLDLQIKDGDDDVVDSDVEDDDNPVLEFETNTSDDPYTLTVDMVECSENYCLYGIDIYAFNDTEAVPETESTDYQGHIDAQLAEMESFVEQTAQEHGLSATRVFEETRFLTLNAEERFELSDLASFSRHMAVAVCDQDCGALSLKAESKMATLDPEFSESDGFPAARVAEFVTRPLSDHAAIVSMDVCAKEPCLVGLAVYEFNDAE
ncbi:MAG: hypothetical protein AAFV59_04350 [Pseudomonadota bacterium]